jgi:hypothetical protein
VRPEGYVDNAEVSAGDGILVGSEVRTSDVGALRFGLDEKIDSCTLGISTSVVVRPTDDVLIDFRAGNAICVTDPAGPAVEATAANGSRLRLSDPLFMVTVEDDVTTIRVVQGFMELTSTVTGASRFLAGDTKAEAFEAGGVGEPDDWGTGEIEDDFLRGTLQDARDDLPDLDFDRPNPDGSPTLSRIAETEVLRTAIDETLHEDGFDGAGVVMSLWLHGQIVEQWDLRRDDPDGGSSTQTLTASEGFERLAAGEIELFITPDPGNGQSRLAFFDDPQDQRIWVHHAAGDDVFGDAMHSFVRNLVLDGRYSTEYQSHYGQMPDLEAVASLFGLE